MINVFCRIKVSLQYSQLRHRVPYTMFFFRFGLWLRSGIVKQMSVALLKIFYRLQIFFNVYESKIVNPLRLPPSRDSCIICASSGLQATFHRETHYQEVRMLNLEYITNLWRCFLLYHRERILETSTLSCSEEEEEITKPPKR
jgi:hypothetical protein